MEKILIIRRDNIGDLILTTPLLTALRQRWPQARLDALVNSYNAPVLARHPALNHVYCYTKGKHRLAGQSLWGAYWGKVQLLWQLRQVGYDAVVLAQSGYAGRALGLAHWIAPGKTLGFAGAQPDRRLTTALPVPTEPCHHVEALWPLAQALGVTTPPDKTTLYPDPALVTAYQKTLFTGYDAQRPVVGVHISARKPSQRWPVKHFIELITSLCVEHEVAVHLFWSPGSNQDKRHPGDDDKARQILDAVSELPVRACPTQHLEQLFAGLALCDSVICSDGGAMHVAAALDKPIVCFFGQSDVTHWRPWKVPHRVLQASSHEAQDIPVAMCLSAWRQLMPSLAETAA